jgi:hypothetical protein
MAGFMGSLVAMHKEYPMTYLTDPDKAQVTVDAAVSHLMDSIVMFKKPPQTPTWNNAIQCHTTVSGFVPAF